MTAPAIRLTGVSRRFGRTTALADVTTEVPSGIVCGLLGRNGAGKTTLMSILAGHDRPSAGTVEVLGSEPFEHAAVMSSISLIRDNQRYPEDFKLKHVLRVAPRFHERWDAQLAAEHELIAGGVNRAREIGVVDEVVDPSQTRRRLVAALAEAPPGRGAHGNIPL